MKPSGPRISFVERLLSSDLTSKINIELFIFLFLPVSALVRCDCQGMCALHINCQVYCHKVSQNIFLPYFLLSIS